MSAYDQFFAGDLSNYTLTDAEIAKNVSGLEKIV
jgi:tryptophan synthase beta chain